MIMFAECFDDNVVNSGDGSSTAGLLLDARPPNLRPPARVFVETPLAYLHYQVAPLRQTKLRL